MCGISGWFLKPGELMPHCRLEAMAEALAHRGPDDRGFFFDDAVGIGLANNRLSIIDLSPAGHQPMVSPDGRTVLVYNGELYNFLELRAELQAQGHQFHSRTDSEVVLRAFLEWGPGCLERFCGMFALALWSDIEKKLLLARDPLGMKPLYWTNVPGDKGLVFASELKAFLSIPEFRPRINRSSLQQFLEFGYAYEEQATSLEGVSKVPPGHLLEVIQGRPGTPRPYYQPPRPEPSDNRPLKSREEELYETLTKVVAQHLIADVPVGLLLSGGVDSSVVAALAARQAAVTTVCMAFAESRVDERSHAQQVAQLIGSRHVEVLLHPEEISEGLEESTRVFDDLFADWGTISTRLLYRKCRDQGIKVVIVGEGSDELFGGYPIFEFSTRISRSLPTTWNLFQLYRRYAGRRYGRQFGMFSRVMKSYLQNSHGDWFEAVRQFESRRQLPNNYVMKVDKASMSVSVEARAPYLDRRVAEIAYRTPSRFLQTERSNKHLLRSMAERFRLLPPEIAWRPKFGASMAASWMDESAHFRQYARQVILEQEGWVDELRLRPAMTDFFDGHKTGYAFPHAISLFSGLAWRLLLLNLWSRWYLCH